jgi:ParB/RepB/Spo0J family partition protein
MAREIDYVDPKSLVIVGLDTDDREEHPLFDERVFLPADDNLVKNILVFGIQLPVLIRREAGKMYVVDGRQRTRAARKAAEIQGNQGELQVKVPVREVKQSDSTVVGIMVSTNEQRQDDDVLTKAAKAARMIDMGVDMNEVAIAFGRSKTTIKNWLSLLQADTRVQAAVRANQISSQAGVELSRMPRGEQKDMLDKLIQAAGGERVSESQAKAARQEAGDSSSGGENTAAAAPNSSAGNTRSRAQAGIKRTWLRKALKTEAAKALTDEQRGVLEWFSTGQSEAGTWYDDFRWDAETEMDG